MSDAFLKTVTLRELDTWLKKNPHVTWNTDAFKSENKHKPGFLRGKYLNIRLDTRDMKIFRIELIGLGGTSTVIDFRDSGEGSILDELDRRLTEDVK